MRGTIRVEQGRLRRVALAALLAVAPVTCLSSAAGPADWSKLEFTGITHHGKVHVLITTREVDGKLWLDDLKVDIDGKKLALPKGVSLRLPEPRLFAVALTTTKSVTCIDGCPDIGGWPSNLEIPYGEYNNSECKYSWLQIDFVAGGVSRVALYDCGTPDIDERILYEFK